MAVYFGIGDIHGCMDELLDLYGQIESIIAKEFSHRTDIFVVFLGDYVDRGPNSKKVVEFLIQLDPDRHIILPGNHEQVLMDFLISDGDHLLRTSPIWFRNGGLDTLASYAEGKSHPVFNPHFHHDRATLISARALVTEDHKAFLQKLFNNRCPYFKDDVDKLFFVHAGINPSKRLVDHSLEEFLWSRHPSLLDGSKRWMEDGLVIHGHTPCGDKPLVNGNRISVDTGCAYGGKLSSVILVDGVFECCLQSS